MKNARVKNCEGSVGFLLRGSCISNLAQIMIFQQGSAAVPGQLVCLARLVASMRSPQSRAGVRNE